MNCLRVVVLRYDLLLRNNFQARLFVEIISEKLLNQGRFRNQKAILKFSEQLSELHSRPKPCESQFFKQLPEWEGRHRMRFHFSPTSAAFKGINLRGPNANLRFSACSCGFLWFCATPLCGCLERCFVF